MKRTPLARAGQDVAGSGRAWNYSTLKPGKPLERSSQPRATASTKKVTPIGAATGQRKPPGEFTPKVKMLVRKRAGRGDIHDAACEGCGRWLGFHGGEYQHRQARGSGGCRDEVVNGPANCLLLCRSCHSEAEERRRDLSQDGAGFWIGHGTGLDYDPRFTPVMLGALGDSGVTVWLAADGLGPDGTGYLPYPPVRAVR